ncbi:hypothetical protein FOL47_009758 [Perkinsus chesapeaki]|uniref:Uncharacterized protein n=1 Tax=Perkinsus chesapeaki TaxID=330153 RepID=A0A7J6MR63_PERCH|nr:hypothetical protein FOL47_009758 [Perkinsus chesapeaki]
MAFVYRAAYRSPAFDSPKATAIYPNIGPGTYIAHEQYIVKPRPVEAPFGTTTTKTIAPNSVSTTFTSHSIQSTVALDESKAAATAADFATCSSIWAEDGKYRSTRVQIRDKIPRMVPFNLHAPRFNTSWLDESNNVGPGQYEAIDGFGKAASASAAGKVIRSSSSPKQTAAQQQHLTAVRRNAPSIPCAHQSYGYKESSEGELVPQDNNTGQYSDNQQRPVGGQCYQQRKKRCTEGGTFGKCPRDMPMQDGRDRALLPGPGYYNTDGEKTGIRKFHKLHSAFTRPYRLTNNKTTSNKVETPGPGHYDVIKDITTTSSSDRGPAATGCFGSTSRRFDDFDTSSSSLLPGPGYYRTAAAAFNRSSVGCKISPEGHSTKRKDLESASKPGPGYYTLKDLWQPNEATVMNERAKSGCSTFGSTANRFTNNNTFKRGGVVPAAAAVGTGVEDISNRMVNDTRTYITRTLSNGERDRVCLDDLVANNNNKQQQQQQQQRRRKSKQVPFSSTAQRFGAVSKPAAFSEAAAALTTAGFGDNATMNRLTFHTNAHKRAATATALHSREQCSSFLTREPRFHTLQDTSTTPGPGYYTIPQDTLWGDRRVVEGESNITATCGIDTGDTIGFASSQRRFKGYGSYITPDTTTRIPYKPSPQQQASYQYRHASLADNISDHPECIGSYGLPHHYDRRPSPISRPGFEGPTPYRADTIDHTRYKALSGCYDSLLNRPSSNIPTGKENTQDINDYDQQYVTNYGEPDGETEPARADDYDEDVSNNMVSNFPIGWKTATRLIPSGEVKREYNMTANRATGVPIHRVRHEAIRFFQILMSPEQPYLQSVGDGWCVNGFMYRLTRDDDVGVLIRQINDGGDNGKDSLLMLNVVMKDVKIERMTPKISAAIEAWDYAIRELVNGNAKAQMVNICPSTSYAVVHFFVFNQVRSQRNGAFRSYLDQYYFPGIPTSCLPSWVKLSRPPRVVKQEYLTQDQVYGRCTQGTSQQAFINPSGNETFHRQGVTYGGGGVSLLSSSSAGVCDEYRVLYDI